jgi:hypothetical protein
MAAKEAQKSTTNYLLPIILGVVVLIAGFSYWNKTQVKQITKFEECVAAGYPVLEKYPRQCNTPDGKTFTQQVDNPPVAASEDITIKGELVCLPYKDQNAIHDANCALGLKDESGIYYSLNDTDPEYKNVAQPSGKQYVAVGKLTPKEDSTYDVKGTIEIQSLTPVN